MSDAKHTPTLRCLRVNGTAADFDIVNEHGGRVASTPYQQHAERICRAYNAHDALVAALERLDRGYVNLLQCAYDRIRDFGGTCDPVDVMERGDTYLADARSALKAAKGAA